MLMPVTIFSKAAFFAKLTSIGVRLLMSIAGTTVMGRLTESHFLAAKLTSESKQIRSTLGVSK